MFCLRIPKFSPCNAIAQTGIIHRCFNKNSSLVMQRGPAKPESTDGYVNPCKPIASSRGSGSHRSIQLLLNAFALI